MEKDLEHIVHQIPQWEKQRRDEMRQLNRDTAKYAVDQLIEEAKAIFKDIPRVIEHIEAVRADLVENVGMFIVKSEDDEGETGGYRPVSSFDRYEALEFSTALSLAQISVDQVWKPPQPLNQ